MNSFIEQIKTIFFFPLYIRKNNRINLELQQNIIILKNKLEANSAQTDTLISSLMSTEYGLNRDEREHELIVSLTTHSYRIEKVSLAIQSLMDQDFKADKIILSINKEIYSADNLPKSLRLLENRGLTINYCRDIGPYTKLLPVLSQYPNNIIITVDDDVIYPRYLVRKLYYAYLKEPNYIHCLRMHYMKFKPNGKIKPYREWDLCSDVVDAGYLVFPTGVGGVLYPPNSFNDEIYNEEAFLNLSPGADDVWFKAMSLLQGVKCKKVDSDIMNTPIVVRGTEDVGLMHENLINNKNDLKIEKVFNAYNLWEKLK